MRAGDVADGQHVRVRRAQVGVDDDPVLDVQPGRLGEVDARSGPDPDDDQVGVDQRAVGQLDRTDVRPVARGDDLGDLGPRPQVDPVLPVQVREHRGELRAEHAEQRQRVAHEDAHLAAGRTGGGGDLETDPPAADDHDALAGRQQRAQAVAVVEGPQVDDTVEVGAGHVEPARLRAGREDEVVPARPGARSRRRRRVRPGRSTGPSSRAAGRRRARAYQSAGCTNAPSRSSLPCR